MMKWPTSVTGKSLMPWSIAYLGDDVAGRLSAISGSRVV
jgi:hypothetical protein